ncbi:MAG: gamma-glutamylcyclotransferase [Bradymonadaceae bacterium]
MTDATPDWIFGYGSLIWRPDFEHDERRPARLSGWLRRFYQYSVDHRGVPDDPGRVVTLLEREAAHCWGAAFRVGAERVRQILTRLDERESKGYDRRHVDVELVGDGGTERVRAAMYIATPENAYWAGPAPVEQIARRIARAEGPSGLNREYLFQLAAFLDRIDVRDRHVDELEHRVRRRIRG